MKVNAAEDASMWSHWIGELQVFQLQGLEVTWADISVFVSRSNCRIKLLKPK
jgi:hypothetical protein